MRGIMVCFDEINANIAQLVEQRIRNAQVDGSIPSVGSIPCRSRR